MIKCKESDDSSADIRDTCTFNIVLDIFTSRVCSEKDGTFFDESIISWNKSELSLLGTCLFY